MRSLWTATTGMSAQNLNMDVIANNLANVSTSGFKKSRADFQDLLYQIVKVPGSPTSADTTSPTGIQVGLGVKPAAVTKIFTTGDIVQTSNPLDIAIEGTGFFQVSMPDGTTAYTRAGTLKLDGDGRITTSDGYPVEPEIVIPEDALEITISPDGTVSAILGSDTITTELGNIDLADFVNDAGLIAIGKNLFRDTEASGPALIGTPGENGIGTLLQGYIENSNVNLVEELTQMITAQRSFEINSKVITTSDEMMRTVTNMV
ncbi:flagellar basal-body rod protein FlgG [Desulfobulbus oligotrophicus]|jgi:flagellar basal-body rod protein FlgG|uniref:Flagellar basal-body rod protein FlgG n=1 Tax=Desulfobulbus oligotrophicus TaxID=1909699 RepID=A0A7T5VDW7_9BACT|nr:flagellar basal-body rod protein FlgG [Desulfobulbus oligotrophicus]MDY0389340.1 flagellar basal-body rod protein FlgG [Desulfobulbus oligotrophicus]QQG66011.1 flagellar basal-body rod protein FlgG [Desulfobulbus oligotrophicus]